MVRSLPHPSAFADIDAKRIAGNTVVVLVHVLAFAVLMAPSTWEPPVPAPRLEVVVPVVAEPRLPPPIPPPPADPIRLPRETRMPTPVPTPRVDNTPVTDTAPVLDTGTELAEPSDDAGPVVDTFDPGLPQVETLAYDVSPAPRYPRQALRSGAEGTVVLKVLVDAQGRPQQVVIERSSGHRLLDQAARDQVLAKWRFQPATRQGRAVAAYALVPIAFDLP